MKRSLNSVETREKSLCPHTQLDLFSISIQSAPNHLHHALDPSLLLEFTRYFSTRGNLRTDVSYQDTAPKCSPSDRQVGYGVYQLIPQAPHAMQCTPSASCYKNTTLAAGNTNLSLQYTPGSIKNTKNNCVSWQRGATLDPEENAFQCRRGPTSPNGWWQGFSL